MRDKAKGEVLLAEGKVGSAGSVVPTSNRMPHAPVIWVVWSPQMPFGLWAFSRV